MYLSLLLACVDQDGVRYAVYSRQVITAVAAGTNDVVSDADCCSRGTYYDVLWCRICCK